MTATGNTDQKKSIAIWGAGKIGRGFLADLFSRAGYHLLLVDTSRELVTLLQDRGQYTIVNRTGVNQRETVTISDFTALHISSESLQEAIAATSLIALSVFPAAYEKTARAIGPGIEIRASRNEPLNILVCSCILPPVRLFRSELKKAVSPVHHPFLAERVGLAEALIRRIATDPSPDIRKADPLAVVTNGYPEIPIDSSAFRGSLPDVPGLLAVEDLRSEKKEKALYFFESSEAFASHQNQSHGGIIMKTKAVRLYGKKDLRLEEFELPPIQEDEILAHVVSDSICMSSYKAAIQGPDHKRIPDDVAQNPVIIGHEFAGELVEVGKKWSRDFSPGDKFSIQPALNYQGRLEAPGYSFPYIGGDATYVIIPDVVMEQGCLLPFGGEAFFHASLSEPVSCIIGAFHASYHTEGGKYVHQMGIVPNGNMAILAGAGPMGLGAVDYAIHCDRRPKFLVVTDIDENRLKRAESIFSPEEARRNGVTLQYVNTLQLENADEHLLALTDHRGYDDVFVFAPVKPVVEQGDRILGRDGCLNFFAGPTDQNFSALFNFYNVHYASTHLVGTSGGNTDDMKEALLMMEQGKLNPAVMVTHIGGLNAVVETTLNLPSIPGGKKLMYTTINLPLTPITEFSEKGKTDPLFQALAEITERNNGLWSAEAERYLLKDSVKE